MIIFFRFSVFSIISKSKAKDKNIKNENFDGGKDNPNNTPEDITGINIFLSEFLNNINLNDLLKIEMKN